MLTYLIQLTICWMILFTAYLLFLKRETFFRYNRWYLLSALILGLVIPLVDWAAWFTHEPDSLGSIYITPVQAQIRYLESASPDTTPAAYYIPFILIGIYGIGVLLAGLRMVKGIRDILSLRRGATILPREGYELVLTRRIHMPFSFLNAIYWSEDLYEDSPENNKILLHETKHVRAFHSLDVLFLEILCVLFWFHPFVHLYRAELRQIHEYEADAAACLAGSKKEYGQILIHQAQSGLQLALANHFFYSQLKNRIKMITKKPSHQSAKFKYLLAVPFLALTALLFSFSQKEFPPVQSIPSDSASDLISQDTIPLGDSQPLIIINSKKLSKEEGIQKMNELPPHLIESIDVLKDPSSVEIYGKEGKNGVILITTKGKVDSLLEAEVKEVRVIPVQAPKATDLPDTKGAFKGIAVSPEKNGLQKSELKNIFLGADKVEIEKKRDTARIVVRGVRNFSSSDQPLIVLDGEPLGHATQNEVMKNVDPNSIESVSVLKGKSAAALYGTEGTNGVIIITTKIQKMVENKSGLTLTKLTLFPNPASHELVVDFEGEAGQYQMKVLDITGATHLQKTLQAEGRTQTRLDIAPLNAGMYYLLIQRDGKVEARPFIKE